MLVIYLVVALHELLGLEYVFDEELNLWYLEWFRDDSGLAFLLVKAQLVLAEKPQQILAWLLFIHFPQEQYVIRCESFPSDWVNLLEELEQVLDTRLR